MNITVYLGSNMGNDPSLADAARDLGKWIGQNNHTLIYGGSGVGLMRVLADGVLTSNGEVIGVELQMFIDKGLQHSSLTKQIVTSTFSERKAKMIELGEAFIAFPGGLGTLEEISEVMTQVSLGLKDAPCIVYNLNGYYDNLKQQFETMIKYDLSSKDRQKNIHFVETLDEIKKITKLCNE